MRAGVAWKVVAVMAATGAATVAVTTMSGATTPLAAPTTAPGATTAPTTVAPPAPDSTVAPTTTLPPIPADVVNPECARVVQPGDSLSAIADQVGFGATVAGLSSENGLGSTSVIQPGDVLDICAGNGVDDLTGASRVRPETTVIAAHDPATVMAQQQKLNDLFWQFGTTPLGVDGASGRLTRQQLCAARVLLGLPVSRSDMAAGSDEHNQLLAMTSVSAPPGAPTRGGKWALLDLTCQVGFFGEGDAVKFVFPISTGEAGYDTRIIADVRSFRFNPAVENGGWHDSSEFPVSYDNPLNGNMYKPIYFNNGQAIHGANNVPSSPASKGCVRLTVTNQDLLVDWLGLAGATSPVWAEGTIGLRVTTQGAYLPDP